MNAPPGEREARGWKLQGKKDSAENRREKEKGSPQSDCDWSKKRSEERTQKKDEKR